jgi:hypothetical protein
MIIEVLFRRPWVRSQPLSLNDKHAGKLSLCGWGAWWLPGWVMISRRKDATDGLYVPTRRPSLQEIHSYCKTGVFITVLAKPRQGTLYWSTVIQPISSQPTYFHKTIQYFLLIFLGLLSGISPYGIRMLREILVLPCVLKVQFISK